MKASCVGDSSLMNTVVTFQTGVGAGQHNKKLRGAIPTRHAQVSAAAVV